MFPVHIQRIVENNTNSKNELSDISPIDLLKKNDSLKINYL